MLAYFVGCGLHLSLNARDKKEMNESGKLEGQLKSWKKAKVIFRVVEEITKRDSFEESGFHIKAIPKISSPEERTKYFIFLDKENWKKLTNPEDKIKGGYFVSRCMYDRVDIVYYG